MKPATEIVRRTDAGPAPEIVYRRDRGTLLQYMIRADGSILAEGFAAKAGVLVYIQQDGSEFREYISAKELGRTDSLGTLARVTMTFPHPPKDVGPDNHSEYSTGDVDGSIVFEEQGGYVKVRVAIRRADAVEAFLTDEPDKQARQLSPGYKCTLLRTPGVTEDGERYDAIQTNRIYNHLAQVPQARGGKDIAMRTDEARVDAAFSLPDGSPTEPTKVDDLGLFTIRRDAVPSKEDTMKPELIALLMSLGVSATMASNEDAGVKDAQRRVDAEKEEKKKFNFADLQKANDALQAECDQLKADMEEMKKKGEDTDKQDAAIHKAATERAPLLALAESFKMDAKEVAKLDNAALRKAIVLKKHPDVPTDRSDDYFHARCDSMSISAENQSGWESLGNGGGSNRTDGGSPKKGDGADDQKREDAKLINYASTENDAFDAQKSA